MKRIAAIVLFALLSPLAQAAVARLYVVKVISFDCPACRAALAIDAAVEDAAAQAGAKVVYAPLPRQRSSVREQFFYAMQGMGITQKVMSSLFSGAQGLGYPLMTQSEVLDWLRSSLASEHIRWSTVLRRVDDGQAETDVRRAILLAYKAGVTNYPSYVFVRDNKILGVLDIATAGGSLSQLRSAVIAKIQQLSPGSGN
ncbi:MAG: thioredoxin domain-containing protein [Steroidobacteraceae bacterium]